MTTSLMPITFTGPTVPVPRYATASSAGLDLALPDAATLPARTTTLIDLGVRVAIPAGHVGLIFERSSLHTRGLQLANSVRVIDADYRGPIKAAIKNLSSKDVELEAGERLVQLVIMSIARPPLHQMDEYEFDERHGTRRGEGGFGSTGV